MKIDEKKAIGLGLMSGTSLDGLDMAVIQFDFFEGKPPHRFQFLASETYDYPIEWKEKLASVFNMDKYQIAELDFSLGHLMTDRVKQFLDKNALPQIDFIASHGHTLFHEPQNGFTLQIGDVKPLAHYLNSPLVYDFRTQDVKFGGQGAPLVPIGDRLLFGGYDFCLNLGGFANVSYEQDDLRLASDICPVNTVLNSLAEKLGQPFDFEGKWAAEGKLIDHLLDKLNALSFYHNEGPKSLGVEFVREEVQPLFLSESYATKDLLRTYVEHVAIQVAKKCSGAGKSVLVTGGGVLNTFLFNRIKQLSTATFIKPELDWVNFKEALIFALLGFLKLNGQINCLASVTGAGEDHSSGIVFNP